MVLHLLLSLFLPPVAVALTVGVSTTLLLNISLTLLGWVPGIIHALWVITKQTEEANA
jgi:uncharacterized membrane protein YqaE (UPF0057 family)